MGWAAALVADLLFGSRLQGALQAEGIELVLAGDRERLAALLSERAQAPDLLLLDLGDPALDAPGALTALRAEGTLRGTRTLGFYSHVHPEQREAGDAVGIELIVPRSRLAREAPVLVRSLLSGSAPPSPAPGGADDA